jgi:type IV secretory pathway VirB2 component (pilin)
VNGLFASSGSNALVAASDWIVGLLRGPLATGLAILAVAAIGALMLRGRVSVRHAAQVLLGCFLLFGAASLAASFRSLADYGLGSTVAPVPQIAGAPPLLDAEPTQNAVYDPDAAAAVRYNE